jgi:hypothetical protein
MGECYSSQLLYMIALVNWGAEAAALYCPSMNLDVSRPRDRKTDIDIVERVARLGVDVAVAEVREIAGLRAPEKDEELLKPPPPPPNPFAQGGTVPEDNNNNGIPDHPGSKAKPPSANRRRPAERARAAGADDGTQARARRPGETAFEYHMSQALEAQARELADKSHARRLEW